MTTPLNPDASAGRRREGDTMTTFHWRDNWFFKRGADGTVIIRHDNKETHRPDAEIFIPPHEWASIVASVCARGETAETYQEAMVLHG